MRPFELIEHTADVGIRAFGSSREEVFQNAAAGMFGIITDTGLVKEKECVEVRVVADDLETLLVEWLNELLYLSDSRSLLFSRFEIRRLGETSLDASACGEQADIQHHELKADIKAATYHMLKMERTAAGWQAQVIFDI